MPRNRVVAIIVSIAMVTIAYVMWQKAEPPKPVAPPIGNQASSASTDKPNLGKVEK
jgi:hypothetical protein